MKEYVLWSDAGPRLILGLLLLVAPRATMAAFGLPKSSDTFWPRLIATILLALAVGAVVDMRWPGKGGPALGGLVILNIATSFALATGLVVGQLDVPRRGRIALWLGAMSSAALAFVQLAWV